MGEIILSQAGAALGARLLPGGLGLLGGQLSGAAIGSALGGLAGRAIDNALRPAAEGPRIKALHVMNSADGAGMANIYGHMRVGGQLIWASRFKEKRRERRAGKGGPKVADYTYSVSLAVAIAEGPVTRLDRVWANGETLRLSDYNWRLYKGGDDQLPDPLIEAIEGTGAAPAYRGTAYIVFEDMPLDAFGNRLPQLSFEVVRASDEASGLRSLVRGVNVIPASGEFVYGTDIVRERRFPGIERPLNINNGDGRADFALSLEQLESDLPDVGRAALTVGWFGDDLRAGSCQIRPGVETRERASVPYGWTAAGQGRSAAHLVSQTGGSANYGGTPADRAVIEGIQAMKAQGLAVTLSPFLFMDIPAGNGLPDPYGGSEQAAFPWRGRIMASADGTAAVRSEITAFLGSDHDFGFRHFILHHARLAVEAGGVEAILIGGEMRGLTRLRDETGAFPFVEGLVQLAADVKAIVGTGTKVSYAADWTEYGAYVPADGAGDVLFPLDTLWASANVDFVGIDWYPPAGDWREGDAHLDALAGYEAADDPAYLASQMAGGEAYDWYYASPADRDAQIRTPITDTAHGEDWIFRQKDLAGWWGAAHHERPGGIRQASPTAWTPGMKPVRLMEIGFPAVDKGANAPNVFYDPKSSESALPPYSSGERNDLLQRHALEAALAYWQAQPFMEQAYVWAWDGRPWPDFPVRESVWSDGPNWALGHWLNGRTGLISLAETVEDLGARAGVSMDASALDGVIEGFALDGPMALRRALEPLNSLQPMTCHERESGLVMTGETGAAFEIAPEALAEPGLTLTHTLLDKRPGRLQLSYISAGGTYAPATVDARSDLGEPGYSIDAALPLVLSEGVAAALARDLLAATLESDEAEIALPPACLALEPGDAVTGAGLSGVWRIGDVTEDGLTRRLSLTRPRAGRALSALSLPGSLPETAAGAVPELILIDGPALPGLPGEGGPLAAVGAEPWGGPQAIRAGLAAGPLSSRGTALQPARIGQVISGVGAGPLGRSDRANVIELDLMDGGLASVDDLAWLSGANTMLVAGETGWELVAFRSAELIGENRWRLSGLLRGLRGSPASDIAAGAICVIVDESLVATVLEPDETGREQLWQAGGSDTQAFTHRAVSSLPWPVAHLRAVAEEGATLSVTWLPCGPDIPDSWDLPDPTGPRRFQVQAEASGALIHDAQTQENTASVPAEADLVRVAEIGADGRMGRWVSIQPGTP